MTQNCFKYGVVYNNNETKYAERENTLIIYCIMSMNPYRSPTLAGSRTSSLHFSFDQKTINVTDATLIWWTKAEKARQSMAGVIGLHRMYVQPIMSKLVVTPWFFSSFCTIFGYNIYLFFIASDEFNVGHYLMYVSISVQIVF